MKKQPLTPAERKRRQREHEQRLKIKAFQLRLAIGERAAITANATARGFEDKTEYLLSLVWADSRDIAKRDKSRD